MKKTTFCQGCWEQMRMPIAIRGPLSMIYRPFGITKSRMHPNLCTVCESRFTQVKKQKNIEIDTSILFADLRGYTRLSQSMDPGSVNELLNTFYDRCSAAIWEYDGIVNKFIGDAVLAIFNFPLVRIDHAGNAVKAAMELQHLCRDMNREIGGDASLGVGIGIHTGTCIMGEVGTAYRDFTAIGPVVNLASRLQGAAQPGEILITDEVYAHVKDELLDLQERTLDLKGIDRPVEAHVINSA